MVTPGLAFALAFQPYRLAVVHANDELLARMARHPDTAANPKLKHAVEFATGAAKIDRRFAGEKLGELAETARAAGVELPALPTSRAEWPSWRAALASRVQPQLHDRHTALSFEAGTAASELRLGWGIADRIAYLRAAAPDQPDLAREAADHAVTLPTAARRLEEVLARIHRPLVDAKRTSLQDWLRRAPHADATRSPGWDSTYAHILHWEKTLDTLLEAIARALDVPLDPIPLADPSPEELRALADVLVTPLADGPRLRLAELAAQREDPRAELIRTQFEIRDLEARKELTGRRAERVQQLIAAHPEWTAPLTELGARDVKFDRGFPWHAAIDATTFLGRTADLFARAPLGSVKLTGGLAGRGRELAVRPELARLTALDLSEQGVTDDDLAALVRSPFLRELRFLQLDRNQITDRGIDALAASMELPFLERVSLDFNPGKTPVDQLEYLDETRQHRVPTEAGRALEQKYGYLRWLHPRD